MIWPWNTQMSFHLNRILPHALSPPVQGFILNRLQDMGTKDIRFPCQVGNGPGYLKNTGVGAGRKL